MKDIKREALADQKAVLCNASVSFWKLVHLTYLNTLWGKPKKDQPSVSTALLHPAAGEVSRGKAKPEHRRSALSWSFEPRNTAYHNFTCICRNWCSESHLKWCWYVVFLGFSVRYCKKLVHGGRFMSWDGLNRWWSLSVCWSNKLLVLELQIIEMLWGMLYQILGHSDKVLSFKTLEKW